jgi:3-hydroxyisobutyrate dehydrogenase-like beta-hydroxyacid dehydrogenase
MKIGYIGLGNMGGGMACCLSKADGFDVVVSDIRREAGERALALGASWADNPAEVAAQCDVVITSLPGPPVIEQVVYGENGLIGAMRPGTTYIDMSTNSPALIRKMHAEFGKNGVAVLDAPVSGLLSEAHEGNLTIYIGGDEPSYHDVKAVFDTLGNEVRYMGSSGAGMITKLVHNEIAITVMAVMAEGFTLGVKAGVDPQALFDAVKVGGFGRGKLIDVIPKVVFPGAFEMTGAWGMPLSYGRKDMALATELGRQFNVPMMLASQVEQDMIAGIARGWANKEQTIFLTLQEERAATSLRVPKVASGEGK